MDKINELDTVVLIDLDLRLVEANYELEVLDEHLDLLEKQFIDLSERDRLTTEAKLQTLANEVDKDEFHWHNVDEVRWRHHEFVEVILPRLFRGPFMVSLWAVYESTVTEIASHIKEDRGLALGLEDIKGGDFLSPAKKYYEHILNFTLCSDNQTWERLRILSVLRNSVAHGNGRFEMLRSNYQDKIKKWSGQHDGISIHSGYLVVSGPFLRDTFSVVKNSLEDLIERYKYL